MNAQSDTPRYAPHALGEDGRPAPGATAGPVSDINEGNQPLSPDAQLEQLAAYFEDHYPEVFATFSGAGAPSREHPEQRRRTDIGMRPAGWVRPARRSMAQNAPAQNESSPSSAETSESAAEPPSASDVRFDSDLENREPGAQQQLRIDTEAAVARIPDLTTHCAQLVLGAGLDHSMPGVAYVKASTELIELDVTDTQLPGAAVIIPSTLDAQRPPIITLHGGPGWQGSGMALDMYWRPTVAALAELSGRAVIDVDYRLPLLSYDGAQPSGFLSLADDALVALEAYRAQARPDWPISSAGEPDVFAFGSAASGATALAQVLGSAQLVLQSPRFVCPGDIAATTTRLREENDSRTTESTGSNAATGTAQILVQNCSADTVADRPADAIAHLREVFGADGALQQQSYCGQHVLITPEQARARTEAAAEFLR